MPRFLDRFRVVLLDVSHTFLFDCDRFGPDQDYFATYRSLGGSHLDPETVTAATGSVLTSILSDQDNPGHYDDFRSVAEHLELCEATSHLPSSERALLEAVFARHECGSIPARHARALHALRATHPLGIISNIWSRRDLYLEELARTGVRDLFDFLVWSSDHRCIKPSPRIFRIALDHFAVAPAEAVYVGDNPRRDVAAAGALGMGTVWIRNDLRPLSPRDPAPDLVVDHLADLPHALEP